MVLVECTNIKKLFCVLVTFVSFICRRSLSLFFVKQKGGGTASAVGGTIIFERVKANRHHSKQPTIIFILILEEEGHSNYIPNN